MSLRKERSGYATFTKVFLVWIFCLKRCEGQYARPAGPAITDVSAMCSSEGITASIIFDGPFSGKIYSFDYAAVHDCIYYNGQDQDTVLFSIPVHRCGTQLSRTSRNMVDQMENRVYVQMELDAQTASDRQFLFVCQLAGTKANESSIRRHPSIPSLVSGGYAIASEAVDASQFQIRSNVPPVNGISIPRVSAFSTDGHLANWPIPGAHLYSASIPPVVSWPRLPLPDPIIPQGRSASRFPVTTLPPQERETVQYAVSSPRNHPVTVPSRAPFIPMSLVKTSAQNDAGVNPHSIHAASGMSKIRTESEQNVIGSAPPVYEKSAAEISAYPWNRPYAQSLLSEVTRAPLSQGFIANLSRTSDRLWRKAKIFKEGQGIGVEFQTDAGHKTIQSDNFTTSNLLSSQELDSPAELSLEIQQGSGPFAPAVDSPIKIGDNITLVVRSKSRIRGDYEYDMFVHSCFASDGQGSTKIDLIDRNGCVNRPQFVSQLSRTKDPSGIMYYFFRITAFKFPGPADVYFSCSVELTPFRNASEICPKYQRSPRQVSSQSELRLFDSIEVELSEEDISRKERSRISSESTNNLWISKPLFALIVMVFCILVITTVAVSFLAISLYLALHTQKQKTLYPMYQ